MFEPSDRVRRTLPLAHAVVSECVRNMTHVDRDQFLSDALYGLMQADERYDPARGVSFPTYACRIMKQRIIDGWRTQYGRNPTSARREQLVGTHLEAPVVGGTTLHDIIATSSDGIKQVDDRAECEWLLEHLPARDAKILWDHCALGIPLATLGRREGLTESRICQIVDAAKKRLHNVALTV